MTDTERIHELAAQLAELEQMVARLAGEVAVLRAQPAPQVNVSQPPAAVNYYAPPAEVTVQTTEPADYEVTTEVNGKRIVSHIRRLPAGSN